MTKQDLLLNLLEIAKPHWPAAEGAILFLKQKGMSDKTCSIILGQISQSYETSIHQEQKEKLLKVKQQAEHIQQIENVVSEKEQKDIENLENELSTL